jgi:hypothetical protein
MNACRREKVEGRLAGISSRVFIIDIFSGLVHKFFGRRVVCGTRAAIKLDAWVRFGLTPREPTFWTVSENILKCLAPVTIRDHCV